MRGLRQSLGVALLLGRVALAAVGEPAPGDVYREFAVGLTNPAKGVLQTAGLALSKADLADALRAHMQIARAGVAGASKLRIRVNGRPWITVPQTAATPCQVIADNPVVDLPVSDLKDGDNVIELQSEPAIASCGNKQSSYAALVVRIFYSGRLTPIAGRIVSPKSGGTIGAAPTIRLQTDPDVDRVELLASYEGLDEDGDGLYSQFHSYLDGEGLKGHVGTAVLAKADRPGAFEKVWNTDAVPDQAERGVSLVARIRHRNGVWTVTMPVKNLTLKRKEFALKMVKPEAAAEGMVWNVLEELAGVTEAFVAVLGRPDLPIAMSQLRQGENKVQALLPKGVEVAELPWPGPMLLLRLGKGGK